MSSSGDCNRSPGDWALAYARLGWHVFPCRDKKPLTPNGFHDASNDVEVVKNFWREHPGAEIGWHPGPSGHTVIDLDVGKNGGGNGLEFFEQLRGPDPDGTDLVASTPSGGRHLVYTTPEDRHYGMANLKQTGIDVRCFSGYVVLPDGRSDRSWIDSNPLTDSAGIAPAWLVIWLDTAVGPMRDKTQPRASGEMKPAGTATTERLHEVSSALQAIEATVGRDDWLKLIFAVHDALNGDERGAQLIEEWSAQAEPVTGHDGSGQYREDEAYRTYASAAGTAQRAFAARQQRSVTANTLFHMARQRGWRAEYDREQAATDTRSCKLPELGQRTGGRLVLSTRRTLPTAEAFVREFADHADGRTLHCHAGEFYRWDGSRYTTVEELALRSQLQPWLHDAWTVTRKRDGERYYRHWKPFDSHSGTIKQALDAVRDHVHIPETTVLPSWMGATSDDPPSDEILSCKSMMLHIPTGMVLQPTPRFFNTCALTFDYDAEAATPARWIKFLDEVFDCDSESIELLQEWMGYLLTADTSQQKILLMVGPRRSGKGTIARVLRELVGPDNVASPTTTGLSGVFGLQPLIGKSLAVVSDARFHGEGVATVVERMLCISGEDAITIDRKYLGSVTMKLPTRFMILSNEIPRLHDNSTALAGRFLILQLRRSFYGQEDVGLTDKLISELPGILNWALGGWSRLQTRGHFVAPATSNEATAELEDLGSPVGAFVRENCIVGPGYRVDVDILYSKWQQWCTQDGRSMSTTKTTFGRDLRAVVPGVKRRRGTEDRTFYEGVGLQRASRAGP